ncbi:MAG: 2-oxoacid:acceptor oxidoreductase family protein [Nanoarchaeota archaeon]|nr:2-oxoacid:acceptor oxidoreductase family protein [Nanoarchaeota archaeon]MBU1322319.1 2-oxoacid:acceptor oxidoreductase family protein [Nanoarchaeota archaeon]MBU1597858.1 2-oxoacid:acceptor oxidoreductase family protein [Nanoarchaeota archaeon]
MSKDIFEIRFHGRGGQGAKTAAALLAEASIEQGKYVQSFPEYGAERQGAPVKAFTRISDNPIYLHSGITNPNVVVVLDQTLLKSIPVTEGLGDDGLLIINTNQSIDEVKSLVNFNGKIIVIDAVKIALEELGRAVTNTAMLGVVEKATNCVDYETLKTHMLKHFEHNLGKDLAEKNVKAFERAYNEVQI